jgi:hypothetical protein
MAEEPDSIAPVLVVVVIYKRIAASHDTAIFCHQKETHIGMFEKNIVRLKDPFYTDQFKAQVFVVQQRDIPGLTPIVVPMKVDKLF